MVLLHNRCGCNRQEVDEPCTEANHVESVSHGVLFPPPSPFDRATLLPARSVQRDVGRDEIAVVSRRAQEKTPGPRISLFRGLSGVKSTLFEMQTETFRKRNIQSSPEGDVPARSSESDRLRNLRSGVTVFRRSIWPQLARTTPDCCQKEQCAMSLKSSP